jgi:hypothetical protein
MELRRGGALRAEVVVAGSPAGLEACPVLMSLFSTLAAGDAADCLREQRDESGGS